MGKEIELLKDHTHLAADFADIAHIVGQFDAINDNVALLVLFKPVHAADKGRFARPRRPADYYHFARRNVHVDAAQHVKISKPFVDLATDDNWLLDYPVLAHSKLP